MTEYTHSQTAKKPLAFFMAFRAENAFQAGNCALALNKLLTSDCYDIVLMPVGDLPDADRGALLKIGRTVIEPFTSAIDGLSDDVLLFAEAKLRALTLLDRYETVVRLATGTAVQRDLMPAVNRLINPSLESASDRPAIALLLRDKPLADFVADTETAEESDLRALAPDPTMVVLTDRLPFKAMTAAAEGLLRENGASFTLPVTAVLGLLVKQFGLQFEVLDGKEYGVFCGEPEAATAALVRFGINRNPWQKSACRKAFPEWHRTHLDWELLGGTDGIVSDLDEEADRPEEPEAFELGPDEMLLLNKRWRCRWSDVTVCKTNKQHLYRVTFGGQKPFLTLESSLAIDEVDEDAKAKRKARQKADAE